MATLMLLLGDLVKHTVSIVVKLKRRSSASDKELPSNYLKIGGQKI